MATQLHDATHLGYVRLIINDMERSLDYYQRGIGFKLNRREDDVAYLGVGGDDDLLVLVERPDAPRTPGTTGLYHFAILTPSRLALAQSLKNLIDTGTPLGGASDHLVSEALYLTDPDGNGIEIYRDRPRDEWTYKDGEVQMAVEPFDFDGVLAELYGNAEAWAGLLPETVIGHVHLHVANLQEAEMFYRDVVGFELMTDYMGSAAFLAAGGYHHHLGINTWKGVGAPPRPVDAVGLDYFTIVLPNEDECTRLIDRLTQAGVTYKMRDDGLFVRDPSQNGILFIVDAS